MWAVRFENVTKRYQKGGDIAATTGHEFGIMVRKLGAALHGARAEPRGKLALDDVSFDVEQGESFALLGANGAGKTTALRLLSHISRPTKGTVRVRGRVGALIEVTAGLEQNLSGAENIWFYGSIIGLTRRDIRRRFDTIVQFAEVEHALETQVKYYSTGMQLRLGFAIASYLEPEVFVVDEALSVGDANFQARCVERMTALVNEGTTLLFVSHNLAAVEALCTRGVMLSKGRVTRDGPAKEVLAHYVEVMEEERVERSELEGGGGVLRVVTATLHARDGTERYRFSPHEGMELRMRFECDDPLERPYVNVAISDDRASSLGFIIECRMLDDGQAPARVGTSWECRLTLDDLPLRPRVYVVGCDVFGADGSTRLMDWHPVARFRVVAPAGEGPEGVMSGAVLFGAVTVPYHWAVSDD